MQFQSLAFDQVRDDLVFLQRYEHPTQGKRFVFQYLNHRKLSELSLPLLRQSGRVLLDFEQRVHELNDRKRIVSFFCTDFSSWQIKAAVSCTSLGLTDNVFPLRVMEWSVLGWDLLLQIQLFQSLLNQQTS